jgi:hypothetical protein
VIYFGNPSLVSLGYLKLFNLVLLLIGVLNLFISLELKFSIFLFQLL